MYGIVTHFNSEKLAAEEAAAKKAAEEKTARELGLFLFYVYTFIYCEDVFFSRISQSVR